MILTDMSKRMKSNTPVLEGNDYYIIMTDNADGYIYNGDDNSFGQILQCAKKYYSLGQALSHLSTLSNNYESVNLRIVLVEVTLKDIEITVSTL